MKKKLMNGLICLAILCSISSAASAQIYVKIRPVVPVVVRTEPPHEHDVWVDEEWEPNNGSYRYSGGHWATPPHDGYHWKPGHWRRHREDGDQWVSGRWRRRD